MCRIFHSPGAIALVKYINRQRERAAHSLCTPGRGLFLIEIALACTPLRAHTKAKSNWTLKSHRRRAATTRGGRLERRIFTTHVHIDENWSRWWWWGNFPKSKVFCHAASHPEMGILIAPSVCGFIWWAAKEHTQQLLLLGGSCKIVKKL